MKYIYLDFLFYFFPIVLFYARTPKLVTCKRTEYRGGYTPGMKSNLGYIKSSEVQVLIPCKNQSKVEKIDNDECRQGFNIGGILGNLIALYSSIREDRFWVLTCWGERSSASWISGG